MTEFCLFHELGKVPRKIDKMDVHRIHCTQLPLRNSLDLILLECWRWKDPLLDVSPRYAVDKAVHLIGSCLLHSLATEQDCVVR
jgi:hypothetical protein